MATTSLNRRAEEVSEKLARLLTNLFTAARKKQHPALLYEARAKILPKLAPDVQLYSVNYNSIEFGLTEADTHYWRMTARIYRKAVEIDLSKERRAKACAESRALPRSSERRMLQHLPPAERFAHWSIAELRTYCESVTRPGILAAISKQAVYHKLSAESSQLEVLSIRWNREYRTKLAECASHEDYLTLATAVVTALQHDNARLVDEPELTKGAKQ